MMREMISQPPRQSPHCGDVSNPAIALDGERLGGIPYARAGHTGSRHSSAS